MFFDVTLVETPVFSGTLAVVYLAYCGFGYLNRWLNYIYNSRRYTRISQDNTILYFDHSNLKAQSKSPTAFSGPDLRQCFRARMKGFPIGLNVLVQTIRA